MDKLISNAVNTGRCITVTYYRALVGIPYANKYTLDSAEILYHFNQC